jgi:hypothetical protein
VIGLKARFVDHRSLVNSVVQCRYAAFSAHPYSVHPLSNSDRVCATLTECKKDEEYQSETQTATTDRECKALTVCKDNEEETEAPTPTSDRECFDPDVRGSNRLRAGICCFVVSITLIGATFLIPDSSLATAVEHRLQPVQHSLVQAQQSRLDLLRCKCNALSSELRCFLLACIIP